jgi:predicted dehydrogenase
MASAQRFAAEHDIEHTFDSYESLAQEANVDAVYIATTNDQHFRNAMECVRHGRTVLCEKPLTISAQQTRELVDAARSAGVLLVEAMWMRFQPFVPVLDKLIEEQVVGSVKYVEAHFSFPIQEAPSSRWYDPNLGGGSLLDLGVYPLTLAHYLLGEPQTSPANGVAFG